MLQDDEGQQDSQSETAADQRANAIARVPDDPSLLLEWVFALALPMTERISAATVSRPPRGQPRKTMLKPAVILAAAASVCAALVPLPAKAMTGGAFAAMRAAADGANPVEKVACGWYPSSYPQSWAVYNRGWGCRYAYSGYYYDPYLYRPYDGAYAPPPYRGPYWRPRRWWWAWY